MAQKEHIFLTVSCIIMKEHVEDAKTNLIPELVKKSREEKG